MFDRAGDEWDDSFFPFVVVNVIFLESENVLGYKMICQTSYEIWSILIQSGL